jgi:uncharacterized membrane protein (DUF485 family)
MHSEQFLHSLMRKQLKLSIACALAFLVVLLGLPLANYFFPEFMARRIFGFTLTWFLLGIGFFPAVWVISWFFIKRSIALEESEVEEVKGLNTQEPKDPNTQAGARTLWVLGYLGIWVLNHCA